MQYLALIISIVTLVVAAIGIYIAINIFKRTATLQTETFILNAYKDYMEILYSDANEEHKENAKTQFLSAIDLYCKYVVNGHLDKKLSNDNLHFYKECIENFKERIKEDMEGFNNIVDYAQKYKISLDEDSSFLNNSQCKKL